MTKVIAALVVLLGSAFVIGAQSKGEWIRYSSRDGRYNVSLPQEPKLSTQDTTASTGERLPLYLAASGEGNGGFMVSYFDYGSDMTFSLDKARDNMLEGMHGTSLGEETVSLGASPGKQMRFVAKAGNGEEFIDRARFYDVSMRVYVLQCIFPKSEDSSEITAKCAKFFDSFKVQASQ